MNLDLTSVRAKLARSQEHAQAVERETHAWTQRNPYSLTQKVNAESTRYSIILRVNEEPPFQRWTLMMADALHNLRTALDHFVYAIAVAEHGSAPPPYEKALAFPITDCRSDFDEFVGRRKLGNITDLMRTRIEGFQPYHRPHPTLPPLLQVLRELNNTDKHRMLRLAYGATSKGNFGMVGIIPPGTNCQEIPCTGEVKDGTEILAIIFDRPTPDMHWDQTVSEVVIAMWHGKRDPSGPDWTAHTEFGALFQAISQEVRTVIYKVAGE